jgi:hypothetical protein
LIEWCEDLDYDKYINNWHQLATSSQASDESGLRVFNAGVGELTIGLEPSSQGTEHFVKSNLQYENKLKEHLY